MFSVLIINDALTDACLLYTLSPPFAVQLFLVNVFGWSVPFRPLKDDMKKQVLVIFEWKGGSMSRDERDNGMVYIFIWTTWFLIYMLNNDVKRYALFFLAHSYTRQALNEKKFFIFYILNEKSSSVWKL